MIAGLGVGSRCPSEEQWCAYAMRELPDWLSRSYQKHLIGCRECFVRVAEVTAAIRVAGCQQAHCRRIRTFWNERCALAHGRSCRVDAGRIVACVARTHRAECADPLD